MRRSRKKKQQFSNSQINIQPQLQPRPFATQSSTTNQVADLQTLQEQTQHSDFDFTEVPVFASNQTENLSPIQPKLTIGQPNDKYEQEADQVAHQVVNQINSPQAKAVQKEAAPEEKEEAVQAKLESNAFFPQVNGLMLKPDRGDMTPEGMNGGEVVRRIASIQPSGEAVAGNASAEFESSLQNTRGGGQPLADNVRQPMEGAFNADFSKVKVHTDRKSDQLNQSIQAKAFTTGTDIYFKKGQYNPGTRGGQELLAHELTHVVQQNSSSVQRQSISGEQNFINSSTASNQSELLQCKTLSTSEILQTLQGVQGLSELIGDRQNPQGQTLTEHVTKVVDIYEAQFQTAQDSDDVSNAMKLVGVLKSVGMQIARQLKNPWLAPEITEKLIDYYQTDIKAKLQNNQVDNRDQIVNLAGAIGSADPIMLYMTNKITLEEAAKKIVEMADKAGIDKNVMYQHLYQQYQMELGSYTKAEIEAGTIPKSAVDDQNSFSGEQDLIGEISSNHFQGLLNLSDSGDTQWKDDNELDFKESEQEKLTALSREVGETEIEAIGAAPNKPEWGNLSDPQKRYLGGVESAEDAELDNGGGDRIRQEIHSVLRTTFQLNGSGANRIITDYLQQFNSMPLTISFPASKFFANPAAQAAQFDPSETREYKSALKQEVVDKAFSGLFPNRQDSTAATGSIEAVGKENGMAQHRGLNYPRWRYEKDIKPKGYTDMSILDLPEFAALSPSFDVAQGTENTIEKDKTFSELYGSNQYGSSHFVLKDAVHNRAMYQFTAKGKLRRSPLLLLHDIAVSPENKVSEVQGRYDTAFRESAEANRAVSDDPQNQDLQRIQEEKGIIYKQVGEELKTAKAKSTQAANILHAIVHKLIDSDDTFLDQQQIEVQIFGSLNMNQDVKKIYLDPTENDVIKQNVRSFCQTNGIVVEETTDKKPGTEADGDIDGIAQQISKLNSISQMNPTEIDVNRQLSKPPYFRQQSTKTLHEFLDPDMIQDDNAPANAPPDGCCFITTACVKSRQLADNCEELTTLRNFRDTYIAKQENGETLIDVYYRLSPAIVAAINQQEDEEDIYLMLYGVICRCVQAIKNQDYAYAMRTYMEMVLNLRDKFTPNLTLPSNVIKICKQYINRPIS